MECGYRRGPGRQPAMEQAPAAGCGEHWWPTVVAIMMRTGKRAEITSCHRER